MLVSVPVCVCTHGMDASMRIYLNVYAGMHPNLGLYLFLCSIDAPLKIYIYTSDSIHLYDMSIHNYVHL